jgi:hypothetical protein
MPPPVVRGLYFTYTVDPTPPSGFNPYITIDIHGQLFLDGKGQVHFLQLRIWALLMFQLENP